MAKSRQATQGATITSDYTLYAVWQVVQYNLMAMESKENLRAFVHDDVERNTALWQV